MSILKQKSVFNSDAADLLQNKNLFAPSVHCSYYSCLQLLKVVICKFIGLSYEDIDKEINNGDSHRYLISKVADTIYLNSKPEHTKFSRNIKDLKKFRIDSDYNDIEITSDKSQNAIKIAKEIREQLTTLFKV